MTTEQLQQIADEQFPILDPDANGHKTGMTEDYNKIAELLQAAFIHGLTYDRWIKVTPKTMPSKGDADENGNVLIHWKSGNIISEFWGCVYEDDAESITHWQPITPPKTDKP